MEHYQHVFGHGSAGNEEIPTQPVRPKIRAPSSVGAVASAHEWRRQAAVQLMDSIGQNGEFGEVLHVLRPILRYEDSVTAFIFSLVFLTAVDANFESLAVRDFLISEIAQVFREAASAEVLFDILRDWRDERCIEKGQELDQQQFPGASTTAQIRRRVNTPKLGEHARKSATC